jgi:hypothetical protein
MKTAACALASALFLATPVWATDVPAWQGFAANSQHTAAAPAKGQPLDKVRWKLAIDTAPPQAPRGLRGASAALAHYASPMITAANTVLVPVKTSSKGDFEIDAVAGKSGKNIWTMKTDYLLPPYDWVPPLPAQLTPQNRLYIAGPGGTVYFRDTPDSASGTTGQFAFYGMAAYEKNEKTYNSNVMIDTPITADAKGNIYFGFVVLASNPAGLESGIARIDAKGKGTWISAKTAALDPQITQVAMNCAPALSPDGATLYIAVSNGSIGYLVGLNAKNLRPRYRMSKPLTDPQTGDDAEVWDDSSASPTVAPDGSVYYGVTASSTNTDEHNCRGWLLAFSGDLATEKTPGSFGWDETVSIVPAKAVPRAGTKGAYYLMSKYNNYIDCGSGDGQNRIAILDPFATQQDKYSDVTVMKEVETILNPTKSPAGGVYEWCINSAVVDSKGKSVIANAEDGNVYRWNLATNAFSQQLYLNAPTFEAYTSTLIGPDGTTYAINDATLYAVGK